MDVKILEESENRIRMVLEKGKPAYANSLRRIMISDIPKMAIDDVEFHLGSIRDEDGKEYESISPLFDEIVAHRLGLLPIPTDLSLYKYKDECECGGEGCPNCTIMYTLNKKGPCTVYSGDLEPLGDRKLAIKEDLIPIVKLSKRQALLIYATAVLGTNRQHAKWQAVTACGYKYYPEIELDKDECDLCGLCVSSCPKKIFTNEGGKIKVDKDLAIECNLCEACIEVCQKGGKNGSKPALTVKGDETRFVFVLETDGAIPARDVLDKGLEILDEKFNEFRDKVSEIA